MRPEHTPEGDPCSKCGLGAVRHRKRVRKRTDTRDRRAYYQARRVEKGSTPRPPREGPRYDDPTKVIAIDGEGYTIKDDGPNKGAHFYSYISASTTEGLVSEIGDGETPLSTRAIFDWLLSLPKKPRKVIFSGGYDMTKWCEDLPNDVLYYLWRPDLHTGPHGPKPLEAYVDNKLFAVNLLATRFSLSAERVQSKSKVRKGNGLRWRKRLTMWDLWKFFQCSFVTALDRWGVGTKEEREEIQKMKDQRGNFHVISEREKEYCKHETRLLAALAEKLFAACEDAGIKLRSWYGPGSIAAVMLEQNSAKDQIVQLEKGITEGFRQLQIQELIEGSTREIRLARAELAKKARYSTRMRYAIECAFFGGRFEISRVGPLPEAHSYDIASAYPTAETQLPCLAHGKWKRVRGEARVLEALKTAPAACVKWSLPMHPEIAVRKRSEKDAFPLDQKTFETIEGCLVDPHVSLRPFGPFPFRLSNGAILFPVTAPRGGWCWHHEFLAAKKYPHVWPNVHATEAWVFVPRCTCKPPYRRAVARSYIRRLEWGKAGKGLVMKLGLNSRYGKRAQSIGSAPFRCLVAAGLITSHTRAAILHAIGHVADPWDVASISTDGILTSKPVELPKPPRTGTEKAAKKHGASALGQWEYEKKGGVHLIRPGMRFSLDLTTGIKTTAARGLGVKVLHEYRKQVLAAWMGRPLEELAIQQPAAFHGAKLSINVHHEKTCAVLAARRTMADEDEERAAEAKSRAKCSCAPTFHRSPNYGIWLEPDPHKVSYDPLPKRPGITSDLKLYSWALTTEDGESCPYDREVARLLHADLEEASDMADAQPDGGGTYGAAEGGG